MTGIELVKEYFPDADDKTAGYILWNETSFPMGGESHIRKCLEHSKQARDLGKFPCEQCLEGFIDDWREGVCRNCRSEED